MVTCIRTGGKNTIGDCLRRLLLWAAEHAKKDTLYSIIETVKENGVNPYEYIADLLHRVPNLPQNSAVDELLPWSLGRDI